ncbi:hypothetical protein NDN01_19590 [Sphingomonas sp. QA11]|uniref:hypothetical protein n=1 Tax=Sphingomonas sp. QA11 TaxID=2950605 RepID=UPI00234B4960|nr:hypothetical protein [Sphingomonas sp. QA11]WCM26189.1 hypothetical protein NDN01_19590 [Sphingomonas sp. QA11]
MVKVVHLDVDRVGVESGVAVVQPHVDDILLLCAEMRSSRIFKRTLKGEQQILESIERRKLEQGNHNLGDSSGNDDEKEDAKKWVVHKHRIEQEKNELQDVSMRLDELEKAGKL